MFNLYPTIIDKIKIDKKEKIFIENPPQEIERVNPKNVDNFFMFNIGVCEVCILLQGTPVENNFDPKMAYTNV